MSQISHIKYKDIIETGRLDPDFFKPEFLDTEKTITSKDFSLLGDFFITDGEHGSPERDSTTNIKYVTAEKIKEGYIDDGEFETISLQQYNRNLRASLKPDDLLIYSVGVNCGLSAVFEEHLSPASIPRSVAIVRTNSAELSRFLCIFLISRYGKAQTKRLRAGNAQPMLALEQIKKIKYPLLNDEFYDKISKIYTLAYNKRQQSKQLYQEAEDLLLRELGLKEHTISHTLTFSTTKKEIDNAGRYDADYFQPKYDELIEKIENYKGGREYLENLFKQNLSVAKINSETCNYVEIGDINISNGEVIPNEIFVSDLPANGKRKLNKNDLLISKVRPYRGAVSFIDFDCENLIGSGAFTILQEKSYYKKEVLMVFLKTECIKDLLLRYNCGTSYPVIKDDTILKLKLPLINSDLQKEISDKIKDSFRFRNDSKELLEQAKRMVEDEIEKQ